MLFGCLSCDNSVMHQHHSVCGNPAAEGLKATFFWNTKRICISLYQNKVWKSKAASVFLGGWRGGGGVPTNLAHMTCFCFCASLKKKKQQTDCCYPARKNTSSVCALHSFVLINGSPPPFFPKTGVCSTVVH